MSCPHTEYWRRRLPKSYAKMPVEIVDFEVVDEIEPVEVVDEIEPVEVVDEIEPVEVVEHAPCPMTRGEMAIRLTAQHFKQASRDITGRSRNKAICTVRHVAMVVWLDVVGGNYSKAARRFGRDHTSVMYARDKVANTPELQAVAQMLIDEVNGN